MLSSVTIEGYRGFEHFEMSGLGRVNLLVGPNNGGKTSVLEAIFLLENGGNPGAIWQILARRGECSVIEQRGSPSTSRVDAELRHLFRGHEIQPGSAFHITAVPSKHFLQVGVRPTIGAENGDQAAASQGTPGPAWTLVSTGVPKPDFPTFSLTPSADLHEAAQMYRRPPGAGVAGLFVAAESLSIDDLLSLWNGVSLTSAEATVLRALQMVDPEIERIAVQIASLNSYYRSALRGGFKVKRCGENRPIPVGSMGDGVWRMLGTAIALTQSQGGVLLVDDIDTGLHYSVMSDMWKLIYQTAKELDVQVFATTHSYDCVYSLAPLCASADEQNPITVQRIEHGKSAAIPYALNQVRIAAEHQIEVR